MRKYLNFGSIKFLTGSRAKAEYNYAEKDLFTPAWGSAPGAPLRLSDFESIEAVAAGPWGLLILAKCTFKDGEVAVARVWYSIFEVIYAFTATEMTASSAERAPVFPRSYITLAFFACLILLYSLLQT